MKRNEEIEQLEKDLKALRTEYEKYFAGIERREPLRERDQFKRLLLRTRTQPGASTLTRFKLQQLQASLTTVESYWNRIARQIEEGTYKRDKMRAQQRQTQRDAEPESNATPPSQATSSKPTEASAPKHSASLLQLHSAFMEAGKKVGNPANVSIDALARTIAKQTAVIREQYKCQSVEFKVAIKDGRAILKAVPK
ncbi:MAG: MXAN_5187 C-terminal domain-containing protein [Myxococcota bacterium]